MNHQRLRAHQNTSSNVRQYVRVDEDIEILCEKPVSLNMEKERCSNGSLHLAGMKKEMKYKLDPVVYADDCPDTKFESQKSYYSNAQLSPKKNGNKGRSCMLINSIRNKSLPDVKKNNLSDINGGKKESLCDNSNFNHKLDQPSKQGRKLWKKQDLPNVSKVDFNEKFPKNGPVNSVNKIESSSFYSNSTNPNHIVNEADTPPFTPSIDISCRNAANSSLCSQPDVIYLKTKLASRSTKAKLGMPRKKVGISSKPVSGKMKDANKTLTKEKKLARREIDALYRNLAEISWAQDKDFTTLLNANSGRIKATVANRSKVLSKLQKNNVQVVNNKSSPQVQGSVPSKKTSPKSPSVSKINLPMVKPKAKSVLSRIVKKKLQKSAKIALKSKSRPILKKSMKKKNDDEDESLIRYKLNPSLMKSVSLSTANKTVCKKKKTPPVEEPPVPAVAKKVKKCDDTTANDLVVRTESPFENLSVWGNLFQNPETSLMSVLQRRQELRVTLEPLDTSNLFLQVCQDHEKTPEFMETFNRKSLQQSMLRVFAGVDQKHISSVLREPADTKSASTNGSKASRKRKYDEESIRSSVRQSECAFRYKEIVVRKHENYIQIVLVPNMYKQNCLTIEAMKELKEAFLSARKDTNCKAVLLNSSGSFFCSGIDLSQLHGSNKKHNAEEMAITIRDLILTLAIFPKPVVAAVNGYAIGLGVTLLTFCDVVLSSDKATFCIPSTRLGYIPEGGALLTLPQVVGSTVAIEMLLQGRRLTAEQALKYGLVSEVLWPTQLMEEVVPRILSLVKQPLHVMEATKTMVRCHLWEKLAVQLNHEWRMLPGQWLTGICQQNIKQHLQTGWLLN